RYNGADVNGLRAMFTKLEFTSLIKKFGLDKVEAVEAENTPVDTSSVESSQVSLDIGECSGKDICDCALAVYLYENKLYTYNKVGESKVYEGDEIATVLKSNKIVCHDVKALLKDYDFECIFDVMLAGYVISPSDNSYELDRLAISYVNTVFDDYNGAKIIFSLYEEMLKRLTEDKTINILNEIEIPLAYVLSSMEKEGFRVDTKGILEYSDYLTSVAESCKERIYMLAGEVFNINSPKQLGVVLFEKLGLPHGKKTKTGYSTNAEILEELADKHEIVGEILDYRKVTKLNSTYCEGLLKVADENGRVHTTFNQTVAVTGRLSSTEPNLQNIPIRTELGRNLRKYFITKNDDYVLIDADYSQIELKVLAHMSKDANMINAFRSGMDIHAITASQVFKVDLDNVTDELRKRAKAVNFGIVYGIGDFSLGKDLHVSKKEAKEYINSYFATYPDIHAFIKALIEYARENGYAKTMFGRIRYIPELSASNKITQAFGERAAMNSPIQGTAADIIKIAMINVHKALKEANIDAKLILQVHDELIIEAHKDCVDKAKEILKKEMENAVSLLVPLGADVGVGSNWFLAK
ncbi:MAG: DNA polymerase I, partial [Clostridia bacterium]|nr:DNA polymerase I [Clostridia bacterium]